jgi:hypothetical protein
MREQIGQRDLFGRAGLLPVLHSGAGDPQESLPTMLDIRLVRCRRRLVPPGLRDRRFPHYFQFVDLQE